jgi:hypothetical protein
MLLVLVLLYGFSNAKDRKPKTQDHSLVGFFVVTVAVLVYYAHAFSSFADSPKAFKVMKNYRSNLLLMIFVVSALLLISCSKSESGTNREATAPSTAAPAASPAHTATTTASATEIGVPECDAFLKAYEACIHDKVPAAVRASFDTGLANWRKSWHDLAANPQTKPSLVAACKSAKDSANTSMKSYGCKF